MDFDSFFRSSGPRLLRLAWLLTGNQTAAEDLLQSTCVKVLPHWARISRDGDPEAYMRRALVTTRTSLWRETRREQPQADLPEQPQAEDTARVDDVDRLVRALRMLTQKQRAVVVLRYYADLSEAEVAATLGVSIGTVKAQSSKGLAHLRTHMGTPGGVAPPDPHATPESVRAQTWKAQS